MAVLKSTHQSVFSVSPSGFPKILAVLLVVFIAASFSISYLVSGFIEFNAPTWVFILVIPLFQTVMVFFLGRLLASVSSLLDKTLLRSPWLWLPAAVDAAFLIVIWRMQASQAGLAWFARYSFAVKSVLLGSAAALLLIKGRDAATSHRGLQSATVACLVGAGVTCLLPDSISRFVVILLMAVSALVAARLYAVLRNISPAGESCLAAAWLLLAPAALVLSSIYARTPALDAASARIVSTLAVPALTFLGMALSLPNRNRQRLT